MLKVTLFQKALDGGLAPATLKKASSAKSDFLVLPEHFSAHTAAHVAGHAEERPNHPGLDWLLRLSDSYQGVIVGGSLTLTEDGTSCAACPIVYRGSLIDWYRKRKLSTRDKNLSPGQDPGVFILGGQRFGVLLGGDVLDRNLCAELAQIGIRVILAPVAISPKDKWDSDAVAATARELGLHIAVCCATGTFAGTQYVGRSMMITPEGISWRVSEQETQNEILKTVLFSPRP